MSAARRRRRRSTLFGVIACIATGGISATATAAGTADPSQVTDADVELAALGVLTFGLAHVAEDTVSAPCPMLAQDQLGWYLGQQGYTPNFATYRVDVYYDDTIGEGYPGIDCGVDLAGAENPDPAAPHYPILTAAYLPTDITFQHYLTRLEGQTIINPNVPTIGGEIGGRCVERSPGFCLLSWHRGSLIISIVVAGGTGDITQVKTETMLTQMVPDVVANLIAVTDTAAVPSSLPGGPTTTAGPTTAPPVTTTTPTVPATVPPTAPVTTQPVLPSLPSSTPTTAATTAPPTTAPPTGAAPTTAAPTTAPAETTTAPTTAPVQGAASPVVLTVTDQGDATQTVDLTPVFTVGSTVLFDSTTTLTGQFRWGDGSTLDGSVTLTDTQRARITAVNPDGSYTQELIIESADSQVVSGPPEVEEMMSADHFNEILGLPLIMTFDAQNVVVAVEVAPDANATQDQRDSVSGNLRNNQSVANAFPASPVGAGATWTGVHPFGWDGTDGTFTINYRLESVSGDQWTIRYDYTIDMSQIAFTDGRTVTGTISESGTIVGSISSPLTATTESQTTTAISSSDGFTENSTTTRRTVSTQQS